ncbi:MAG: toll/interleukin-1 receptor domain-containing protein [Phycisphaerae bacterium]|nr:toll/interleukin-1 receptor domain-containing protein [Phycisphaerae bacterium]
MADVFFCYHQDDARAAEHWAEQLKAAGISVWLDPRNEEGTVWTREIVQAIEECSVMIVLLSRGSVHSHNVVKEVSLASERGKSILPVKLEPVEIPSTMQYQLGGLTAVELFEAPGAPKIERVQTDALLAALAEHGLTTAAGEETPQPEPEVEPVESAESQVESTPPAKRKKSWKQSLANLKLKFKMLWLFIRFFTKRLGKRFRALNKRTLTILGATLGAVVLLLIVWGAWPESGKVGTSYDGKPLPEEKLLKAFQRVELKWQKGGFGGISGQKTAHGLAGVYRKHNDKLYLVTQSTAAALEEMLKDELTPPLKIKSYELTATAESNFMRQAERFAYKPGGLDLAILELSEKNMNAGEDYLLLPYRPGDEMEEEDEVILVHWDWASNEDFLRQTPQQITGRRKINLDGREIQGYQIGSGNKTGLLVQKNGDGYFWIGVIAYHDGLASYAISPEEFLKLKPKFHLANREGAAKAITEQLKYPAEGKD